MRGNVADLQTSLEHGQLLLAWIASPVKLFFSLAFRIGAGISVMCELHCSSSCSVYIKNKATSRGVHEALSRELLEVKN